MSLELTRKIKYLKDRALSLQKARAFFAERGVLEMDPGALVKHPPNDSNIDVMSVDGGIGYLHTSPEYALKRLLAAGIGDCFFLGHVYRKEEIGKRHNPEFTMVEWYRIGITFAEMIQETAEFLFLFLGKMPVSTISYREAFQKYMGIDYLTISTEKLHDLTRSNWPRQTCLQLLISEKIEPHLGQGELTALTDFPPEEAALACTVQKNGEWVAERFEIYHEGVELTNGYHELADSEELRRRFEQKNKHREAEGKAPYSYDEKFLMALKKLPDCCGVAIGFDRVLMLKHKLKMIESILPFSWDEI